MGRAAGALGPAPAAAAEGSATTEPVAVGSVEAGEGPVAAGEGPAAGEVGPRRTYDLKE